MSLLNELLGTISVHTWISACIVWIPMALVTYKLLEIVKSKKVTLSTFKIKYWLNANFFVVLFGYVLSLIILRLGDYAFYLAGKFNYELGQTEDFVAWLIPLTWFIQWRLEAYKKPAISSEVKDEMTATNSRLIGTTDRTR